MRQSRKSINIQKYTPIRVLAWPYKANADLNPYNHILYKDLIEEGGAEIFEFSIKRLVLMRWDIVHVHWPDGFWPRHALWKSAAFSILLLLGLFLARIRGAKVVWTTHNIKAHERRNDRAREVYMSAFTRLCDGLICLSSENREEVFAKYPRLSKICGIVTSHGLYDDYYGRCDLSVKQCRDLISLPLGGQMFLSLGNIRAYKGYAKLIYAFRDLPEDVRCDWSLVIVGKSGGDGHVDELRSLAKGLPGVIIRDEFVPDDKLGIYMKAADIFVLPYRDIQNSGAANLAITFGRPILAPNINSFNEIARTFPDMVHLFRGEICASMLTEALEALDLDGASYPDWRAIREKISQDTLELYFCLVERRPVRT